MSAIHRSLARLPLEIFQDLTQEYEHDAASSLRTECCNKLKHANLKHGGSTPNVVTVGDFIKLSTPALLRILDPLLINSECEELKKRVFCYCAPKPMTALSLLRSTTESPTTVVDDSVDRMRHLVTGMPALDACLRGGFRIGTISEILGRAGSGKTQLAMQLCVMAARFGQGAVYIDTEKKLSLQRLREIADERANQTAGGNSDAVDAIEADNGGSFFYGGFEDNETDNPQHSAAMVGQDQQFPFKPSRHILENVTIHAPSSTQELLSVVARCEEEILVRNQEAQEQSNQESSKFPVRLVVLDSIAAPARRDFGAESAPQRVAAVMKVAQMLKRLADQLQLAVVVINQVGYLDNGVNRNESFMEAGSDLVAVRAALGSSWEHCLSTRLLMEHVRDPHRLNSAADEAHDGTFKASGGGDTAAWHYSRGHVRRATVVKSNVAGKNSMNYEVTSMGLVEINSSTNV